MWLEAFLLFIITLFFTFKRKKDREGLPPGDWGWPLIGKLHLTTNDQITFVKEQKKKHGNIFSSRLGSRTYIYLADYETIKATFAKQEFSERVQCISNTVFSLNSDDAFSIGPHWSENRQFTLKNLKQLGMGKKSHESAIMREVVEMVEYLAKLNGEPTSLEPAVGVALVNVIWGIVADQRYAFDEAKCHEYSTFSETLQVQMQGPFILLELFPVLNQILPTFVKNKVMGMDKIQDTVAKITSFSKEVIKDHEEHLDRANPKDFIDMYLMEREAEQNKGLKTQKNVEMDLVVTVFLLYADGSDTTSVTLKWLVLYMALFPEVQGKVQEELDSVVTGSRLPSLDDKDRLPYLEATIHEANRRISLSPLGVPHSNYQEATINGYRIPKNSTIIACQEEVHYDPRYWKYPHKFYPEHFLDDDGKFNNKKEGFLPFSIGRRGCIGEPLAKMTLFLAFSALLKEFKIQRIPGDLPSIVPNRLLFNNYPKPFKVILQKRTSSIT